MKKVIVGIGVPGSGKSTILRELAEKNGYLYICPDDIRAEFTGNAGDQSKNREVWEEAYKRTADSLKEGNTVVFDATFTNPDQRKDFLSFSKKSGAEKIQGILVSIPLTLAQERNTQRERKVPSEVIESKHRSYRNFHPPLPRGLTLFLS